jgi:hypothetical protein
VAHLGSGIVQPQRLLALSVVGALLALPVSVGGAQVAETQLLESPKVESAPWLFDHRYSDYDPRHRRLPLEIRTEYCVGEPPPVLDHIRVVEQRPTVELPYKSALVTVSVRFPNPTSSSQCAGLGYGIFRQIKLKRPVGHLVFLDGHYSPPHIVHRPPKHIRCKADPTASNCE